MAKHKYELQDSFVDDICKEAAYYKVIQKDQIYIESETEEQRKQRLEKAIDHEFLKLKEIFYKNII